MDCTNKFQKTFRTSNDSSTRYLYKKLTTEAYLKLMLYAQEVGQKAGAFNNLTHPDAVEPEEAADIEEIELIDSDPIEAGERREEILDRWDNEVNN